MISIVTPAYNAEKFIAKTIESVLQQTFTDWELIIVNDGSSDGTVEVVNPYLGDRIRLFSQANAGVSVARNKGVSHAKGELIALLDADDYWLPDNLQMKHNLLLSTGSDFVFSNLYIGDKDLKIVEKGPIGTDIDMVYHLLMWRGAVIPGASSNLLLKKECFNTVRFDPAFSTAADQDFSLYLAEHFKGKYFDECTWIYRVYSTSMSRNLNVFTKDHIGVYKKAARNKLFSGFIHQRKCFANLYLMIAGAWWIHGGNKAKAVKFMLMALWQYPPSSIELVKKLKNRAGQ